jgi:hypothetical protein
MFTADASTICVRLIGGGPLDYVTGRPIHRLYGRGDAAGTQPGSSVVDHLISSNPGLGLDEISEF